MFETSMPTPTSENTFEGHQDSLHFAGSGLWELPRLFWQVVTGLACAVGGFATYAICAKHGYGSILPALLISFFAGPGVIYWLLTFLGRAPAEFCIVRCELRVQEQRVFYTRRRTWLVAEIDSIDMGDSSVGGGEDCPLPELQIRLIGGKKFGILRGRNPQVLEQTAQWLRNSLDIPCLATAAN